MEQILFLAHTENDGTLPKLALESLAAAKSLESELAGSSLVAGLVGEDIEKAANTIAGCGASRIFGVAGGEYNQSRYSTDILAVEAIARAANATLIVAPATSRWNRVLSGLACRLNGRIDSHVTGMSAAGGSLFISRWYYRQRMEASLERTQRPWILLVESGCQEAWKGEPGNSAVETVAVAVNPSHTRTSVKGYRSPAADEQTIRPDAQLLFVTGAGWTKTQPDGQTHTPEAEKIILEFLKRSQASLGGSKSLVDLSGEGQAVLRFMTHLNQVGQTGSTPRHPKGLSTCCHGEEPHAVGWRFINERRAINLNPNCGWAQGKADVLYVADAFDVMRKVNQLLAE